MKSRLQFVVGLTFLFLMAAPAGSENPFRQQSPAMVQPRNLKSFQMLDREQSGLRGLVRTCVEESTYPPLPAGDGNEISERKGRYSTDYDSEGRIVQTSRANPDGSEWQTRYQYDSAGHLLKTISGKQGEPPAETVYSYDDKGMLLKITDSDKPDNPARFHYDDQGRKTKVQVSRPEDYRPNVAFAGSPFDIADRAPNIPGGGTATTTYDEHDRPSEVQIRDSKGELLSRALRVYDAQGHITEEKQVLDSPESMIPADMREQILAASGASVEDLREHLTKLMGGEAGPSSSAYSYDSQGRVTLTRRRIFNMEESIETTYNEHGDKQAEVTQAKQIGDKEVEGPGLTRFSEVRYAYKYDDYGDWTEESVSYRSSPSGSFTSGGVRWRTLTYY